MYILKKLTKLHRVLTMVKEYKRIKLLDSIRKYSYGSSKDIELY